MLHENGSLLKRETKPLTKDQIDHSLKYRPRKRSECFLRPLRFSANETVKYAIFAIDS